jgi:hypothetical protein
MTAMKSHVQVLISLLFTGTLLTAGTAVASEIYHWIDEDGNDHFSNIPAPEAENEVISITSINLYTETQQPSDQQNSENRQNSGNQVSNQNQQQSRPPMQEGSSSGDSGSQEQGMMPPPMMEQ